MENSCAILAQWLQSNRASALHAECREFNSLKSYSFHEIVEK